MIDQQLLEAVDELRTASAALGSPSEHPRSSTAPLLAVAAIIVVLLTAGGAGLLFSGRGPAHSELRSEVERRQIRNDLAKARGPLPRRRGLLDSFESECGSCSVEMDLKRTGGGCEKPHLRWREAADMLDRRKPIYSRRPGMVEMDPLDFDAWQSFSTATLSDCLNRFQVMDPAIRSLTDRRLVGLAFTVHTMEGESSTIHRAVAAAPSGCVLVIDAGGYTRRAVWGEVLTAAAQTAGLAGVVLDGVVRDLEGIRTRNFPLYARGVCSAGPHKGWSGRIGMLIQCGGVPVRCADLVIGDEDGVVVVPQEDIGDVLGAATRQVELERQWMSRIKKGESTLDILGIE